MMSVFFHELHFYIEIYSLLSAKGPGEAGYWNNGNINSICMGVAASGRGNSVSDIRVYPIKYAHGCDEPNFVSDSCDLFAHFLQVHFISTTPVICSHVKTNKQNKKQLKWGNLKITGCSHLSLRSANISLNPLYVISLWNLQAINNRYMVLISHAQEVISEFDALGGVGMYTQRICDWFHTPIGYSFSIAPYDIYLAVSTALKCSLAISLDWDDRGHQCVVVGGRLKAMAIVACEPARNPETVWICANATNLRLDFQWFLYELAWKNEWSF